MSGKVAFEVMSNKSSIRIKEPKSRYDYINYLRVLATLFVIFWHSVSDVYYKFGPISEWAQANIAFGVMIRWSVPCFFMISGALLLGKNVDTVTFYKRRFARLVLPLGTWTIIYALIRLYVFRTYTYTNQPQPGFWNFLIFDQFKSLINNNLVYHLYFVSIILALYLVTPFLNAAIKTITKRDLEIFLALGISIFSIKQFFPNILIVNDFGISAPIIYFILGYYLHNYNLTKRSIIIIVIICILSMIWMTYLNYRLEYINKNHNDTYYLFSGFFVFLLSSTVFILFKYLPIYNKLNKLNSKMKVVSTFTYGMYIIHPVVISCLLYGFFKFITINPWETKI